MGAPNNGNGNAAGAIPVYIAAIGSAKNITTDVGTLVKTGAGTLNAITVGTAGTGSTAAIYDGIDNTGTLLSTATTTAQGQIPYGIPFATGLYIVTAGAGAANLTVSYA